MPNEFVVYFKSLRSDNRYITALAYADGSEVQSVYSVEVLKLLNRDWERTEGWVPADPADKDSMTMLEVQTPLGEWNAIVGIAPARWFRALTFA